MSVSPFMKSWFIALSVLWLALPANSVHAQQRGGTPQTDKVQPVNSGANPFRVIRDWAQLNIEARPWGGSNGVAIDRDGKSVWATDRCSAGIAPGCLGSKANPVHLFDDSGKEIRSFGGNMFVWPHGIHVDRDGNVWVTDARTATADELIKFPGEGNKGSVVVKFNREGKVLMKLGKPGVRGNPPEALTDPNDVVTDPENGDIYVAESHTNVADANLVALISVFDKNGKFLRVIGKTGTGPGEIPRAKGVVLAGPVPAAVQVYIVYDAAAPLTNAAPEPALALARHLAREATRSVWIKGGLERAGE